jgi:hypothetical protein
MVPPKEPLIKLFILEPNKTDEKMDKKPVEKTTAMNFWE